MSYVQARRMACPMAPPRWPAAHAPVRPAHAPHARHAPTRGLDLDEAAAHAGQGSLAVDGHTQGVHDASQGSGANGHVDDLASAVHQVTLVNGTVIAEDDNTNVIGLQVEGHALDSGVEADQLAGLGNTGAGEVSAMLGQYRGHDRGHAPAEPYLHALETIDAGDTVTDGQHATQVDDGGLVALLPLLHGRATRKQEVASANASPAQWLAKPERRCGA
jgi:hypothetical protein